MRDPNTALGVTDPKGKPVSQNRTYCYNAITDVLWHYTDASDFHEPEDMRWMQNTTNASRFHPDLRRFRNRVLRAAQPRKLSRVNRKISALSH